MQTILSPISCFSILFVCLFVCLFGGAGAFREEIGAIRQKSAVLSVLYGLQFTSVAVAIFLSVTLMVFTHISLTPAKVFMLLSFMNILSTIISYHMAFGLQFAWDASVSLGRIQNMLLLTPLPYLKESRESRVESHVISRTSGDLASDYIAAVTQQTDCTSQRSSTPKQDNGFSPGDKEPENVCIVSNLTLRKTGNSESYILRDINFEVAQKSLVVMTGPVGSGKSSVLSAINQEVALSEGSIFCPGTIAYVPQKPWVFPGTVRENILFGERFDEERFRRVIGVCALQRDMDTFPHADQTFVGEHGVVLSGGQQARISLARAVYASADIYILDDPLSAVDAKVREHIFQKCICEYLSSKTRILVSNEVSHMTTADQIVLLSKGNVLAKGSFVEMMESGVLDTVLNNVRKTSSRHLQRESDSRDFQQECGKSEDETKRVLMEDIPGGLQISEEDRSIGAVSLDLYWKYFRAGTSPVLLSGLVMVFLLSQGNISFISFLFSLLVPLIPILHSLSLLSSFFFPFIAIPFFLAFLVSVLSFCSLLSLLSPVFLSFSFLSFAFLVLV